MYSRWFKLSSLVLVIVLLINMLPLQVFAQQLNSDKIETEDTITEMAQTPQDLSGEKEIFSSGTVIGEVTERRTEYTKQYRLDNGLFIAAAYNMPVHYEEENQWKEIDNTLTLQAGKYTNTAGVWEVSFPNQLTRDNRISIEKDGYTLSFRMAGQLHKNDDYAVMSARGITGTEQFTTQLSTASQAQLQAADLEVLRSTAEHPELVAEKLYGGLVYQNVYGTTDVRYELISNKVKESVIIESYNNTLRGYQYALEVGEMIPRLQEDGSIHLYDAKEQEIVMVIEAPFLVDSAEAYNTDVQVQLTGSAGSYTLTYLLPQQWLAEPERAWPVILDPVVTPDLDVTNIRDRTVSELTSFSQTNNFNYCGYHNTGGATRFFLKYNELPHLTASNVIVKAVVNMHYTKDPYLTLPVYVHKVQGTWDSSTITWENQPTINENIEDYAEVEPTTAWYDWDVTDIAIGWYLGNNTGMVFKTQNAIEESGVTKCAQFMSSDFQVEQLKPILAIAYRNNNGLESYWDYTTVTAGRAGTGYVNNYSGNLTWVREDMGFGGNLMPVSISHIYNTNDAGEQNANVRNRFSMGNGWRTNYNQRVWFWDSGIVDVPAWERYAYIWYDADGTEHYFFASEEEPTVYKDEDGLQLKLTRPDSANDEYICITDTVGNKSFFDYIGRLRKMCNNQEETSEINIFYIGDSLQIDYITDGADRTYDFTYTSGLLSSIRYYGTGTTTVFCETSFAYDANNNLTGITDNDGETTTYNYSANGTAANANYLLTGAVDVDGYRISFEYNPQTSGASAKVIHIIEFHNQLGNRIEFSYGHNQTRLKDRKGNVQILQFNNMGNTICVQDDEGHAQYSQFAKNEPTDSANKSNQLTLSSKLQNTVGNMLNDSSFENSTLWNKAGSGVSINTSTGQVHIGNQSHWVYTTQAATGIYGPTFTLKKKETVTFSAYVKTGTAAVALSIYDWTGFTATEIQAPNTHWTRLEVSYTNTTNGDINICPHILSPSAGTYWIDGVQLEKANAASRYNLINNGDFRYGLTGWSPANGTAFTTTAAAAPQLDTNVAKVTGNAQSALRLFQTVNISGQEGDCFVFAGWAKGNAAPLWLERDDENPREFAIRVTFQYTDPTTTDSFIARFNPDTEGWQYVANAAVAKKPYTAVYVSVVYNYNVNEILFDGIQLFKEEFGTSYTYDENGNVESVTDILKQKTTYEYDTNSNLTKIFQDNKIKMSYIYDDEYPSRLDRAESEDSQTYRFYYDEYGNNKKIIQSNGTLMLVTEAAYTTDGNRLVSTTDTLGKVTTYGYNADTNVLEWVQYPEDTEATRTNYTYDDMFRVQSEGMRTDTNQNMSAMYTYTDDLLTALRTITTDYIFTYGNFGLRNSVKADLVTLASYTYNGYKELSRLDYGNGDSVSYTYDKQGRLLKETYEDEGVTSYTYDNSGNLSAVTGFGITSTFRYDLTDRLVKYTQSGNNRTYSAGYEYDDKGNLSELNETFDTVSRTTEYSYDIYDRPDTVKIGEVTKKYDYDFMARAYRATVKNGGSTVLTEQHTFVDLSYGRTSRQVAAKRNQAAGYDVTYSYTYDGNGNILSISDGTHTTSYEYDSANQLIRENNQAGNYTYTWTYDGGGNIKSRNEYAYTTGELGTPTDTVIYAYQSQSWRALLTSYDGRTITYDGIGNMLSDGLRTYTWEHGRQLQSVTAGNTTWTNCYDENGIRTERTRGTVTYQYSYEGGKLKYMSVGTNKLYFTYDFAGAPLSVNYNGTDYYYVTNLQGDVVAILNAAGTAVVTYTYDAWGNPLTQTGTMSSTLGTHNPLRYRSYVYDTETQLYYLQSRYYNPEIGRFINADGFVSTGQGLVGNNMFAYCNNNPVMGYDPTGLINWGGIAVGLGLALLTVAVVAATVTTAGAASPLLATVITTIGTVASTALAEATVVTTVGAYYEAPVVYDVTVVGGYDREGVSLVYDFKENTADYYLHTGTQNKSDLSVTLGSGFVENYDKPGDYAGEFLDVSWSAKYKGALLGADYCTSPSNFRNGYKDSHALLWTSGFSFSPYSSKTPTFSYDYYWQLP